MGFVWVHADSFLRCVSSPFHSFVTTSWRSRHILRNVNRQANRRFAFELLSLVKHCILRRLCGLPWQQVDVQAGGWCNTTTTVAVYDLTLEARR